MLCRYCKTVFHNMEKFLESGVRSPLRGRNGLGVPKISRSSKRRRRAASSGGGVGAANSRGERWVKICAMQAFREVFNITDIMLSKKQGGRHARDLNGVIPRVVLPKGHKRGAPRRCFARLTPIRSRRPAALINLLQYHQPGRCFH